MTHDLRARRLATHRSFSRLFPGRSLEGGVHASLVPAAPGRSLFDAVTYRSLGTLERWERRNAA